MKRLSRFLSLFLMLSLLVTSQALAYAQSSEQDNTELQPVSVDYLYPEHYDGGYHVLAGVNGGNGVITAGMWRYDDMPEIGEHNLKIELFYGTTEGSVTNSAGYIETTNLGVYPEYSHITVPATKSYFWKAVVTGTILGDQPINISTYGFFPYNKMGERFPDYYSSIDMKMVGYPESTAWPYGYVDFWAGYGEERLADYLYNRGLSPSYYSAMYIRPLQYGGYVTANNMIILDIDSANSLQNWWRYY